MKYHTPILALFVVLCCMAHAQNPTAPEYLAGISAEFEKIARETMSYISAVNHGKSARKVEKRRKELVTQTRMSEATVRRMRPFKDTRLRDSVAAYFKLSVIVINEDFEKILNMEDIAEQSYDAMEAYLLAKEMASEKISKAYDAAEREYRAFAAENGIRLIENETRLQNKLRLASEATSYHNVIYLMFFKSYKNEAYLMDALNRGDMAAVEQNRNALQSSATEDLLKLKNIKTFNQDATLKRACEQALQFYNTEAQTHMPKFINFQLVKENYEKMQKAINAKKPNNRTQQDIDQYNKAVDEYNKEVAKINKLNDDVNKQRNAMLKMWNDTSSAFLSKHTP